jgi:hypothetical protein
VNNSGGQHSFGANILKGSIMLGGKKMLGGQTNVWVKFVGGSIFLWGSKFVGGQTKLGDKLAEQISLV